MLAFSRLVLLIVWAFALFPTSSFALPTVSATLTRASATTLFLTFSEAATSAASTATNYTLSGTGGLSGNPTTAVLDSSGTSVTLTVPSMAALTHGATVIVTVSNVVADPTGNLVSTYTVDAVPGSFSFTSIANALTATAYESNAISVGDINTSLTLSTTSGSNSTLTCAKFTYGGTAWGSFGTCTSITVSNGDLIKLKLTSASTYSTAVTGGITMGGVSATFSVTTFSASVAAPVPIPSNTSITALSSLTSAIDTPPSGLYISSNGAVVVPASVTSPITLLPSAVAGTAFWIQNGGTASFVLNGASLTIVPSNSEHVLVVLQYFKVDDYANLPILQIVKGRAVVTGALGVAPIACLQLGTGTSTKQLAVLPSGNATPVVEAYINSDGTGVVAAVTGRVELRLASSTSTIISTDSPTALYANEVATLSASGILTEIRVGSPGNVQTVVGDPMTFSSSSLIASDITRQAKIPRLGSALARFGGTDTLLEVLFDTIGLRSNLARGGQTSQGVIPLLIDGLAYYFVPIGNITVDTTRTNGVVLTNEGYFEIARNGVMARFRPSIFDTQGFATSMLSSMSASVALNATGALEVSQSGNTLVMMPEMFSQAIVGTTYSADYDGDGILTFTRSGQMQRLLPAFYDVKQLATTFASMADTIGYQDNMDGTVSVTLTTTGKDAAADEVTNYVLAPAYRVLSPIAVPIQHRADNWWVGDDGLIYLKYSNGSAQGFSIR